MAKRRSVTAMPMFHEPSPKERLRMAAEHFAQCAVEANPKVTRMKQAIARDALRAAGASGRKGR